MADIRKWDDIRDKSAERFGAVNTGHKFTEEMGECIQAVMKMMEGSQDFDHMAEEMADVMITWNKWHFTMKRHFEGYSDSYQKWQKVKYQKLEELLGENENNTY